MKQKHSRIIFILSVIASFGVLAEPFEIYGLKSGITKTQFYELTNCQAFIDNHKAKKSSYQDAYKLEDCLDVPKLWGSDHSDYGHTSMPFFDGIEPDFALEWTHDDKLWRVQLQSRVPSGILQKIAFKDAFSKAYPGQDILESSSTDKYGTKHYLNVVFTDSTLSAISMKHYHNKYLSELNNKK
jgi:hypothetical protein